MNIMATLFSALPDESLVVRYVGSPDARRDHVEILEKLANSCFEYWLTKPDALRLAATRNQSATSALITL